MSDCKPFGCEWEREMMRMRKSDLVNFIRYVMKNNLAETVKKSSAVGNSARMREALEMFVEAMDYHKCVHATMLTEAYQKAKAALSAPPRNCDVGSVEEQAKRFFVFCDSNKCPSCPCRFTGKTDCALIWAQIPYEKGATDEQK